MTNKQPLQFTEEIARQQQLSALDNGEIKDLNPHALAASVNPDILSHVQAKKALDWDQFLVAMDLEIQRMIANEIFEEVSVSEVPCNQRILRAVWSDRRKTTPSGEVYRHRSCLCVDGSQQQYGIDYINT